MFITHGKFNKKPFKNQQEKDEQLNRKQVKEMDIILYEKKFKGTVNL